MSDQYASIVNNFHKIRKNRAQNAQQNRPASMVDLRIPALHPKLQEYILALERDNY